MKAYFVVINLIHVIKMIFTNIYCKYVFSIQADYVCYRGLLTHMMTSIYQDEPWAVLVTNWRGTIYLSEVKRYPIYNTESEQRRMERFCAWGYKFEQYVLSGNVAFYFVICKKIKFLNFI